MNPQPLSARQAIAQAYVAYREQLLAVFGQAGLAACDCEDLVQEVFVRLLGLDLIVPAQLKSLVFVTAYHLRTDLLRHRAARRKALLNASESTMMAWQEMSVECREIARMEKACCSRLKDMDRQVYTLHRKEGKDAQEIAQILDISPRAAESRLFRARRLVRQQLKRFAL